MLLGAGGSSKLVFDHGKRIERVENVKDVSNYIARIDEMIERKRTAIDTWLVVFGGNVLESSKETGGSG